jgi:hypothetical protein
MTNNYGESKVHQARRCDKCGLHEFKVDTRG